MEYLTDWHGRLICHECAVRGSVPLVIPPAPEPIQPALVLHHSSTDVKGDTMNGQTKFVWGAIVSLLVLMLTAGFTLSARVDASAAAQNTQALLTKQTVENIEKRLNSIDSKLEALASRK